MSLPTLKRASSRERAEKAKPIFGGGDGEEEKKVEILFRCGKSRLKHEFEASDTADHVTQFVAKTIQPSGTTFTLQARKGSNKATFKSSGNGASGSKTLADFGLDPRAMIKVIASSPGAVLKGARVPKSIPKSSSSSSSVLTGKVHHVMIKELQEIMKKAGSTPIVVDFFATWCGPCRAIAPHFESMAKQYKDVIFVKIDGDKNRANLAMFNINGFPTFQFYRNGVKIDEFSGANINRLRGTVQQLSQSNSNGRTTSHPNPGPTPPVPRPVPRPVTRPARGGFGGTSRGGFGGGRGRMGRGIGGPRPTPRPSLPPTRKATYDPYGGRFSTLKSISGGDGCSAIRNASKSGKKIFSATDLGFGGRGG